MDLKRSYEKRAMALRTLLFDKDSLSLDEAKLARMTLRNPSLSVSQDRLSEFAEFYKISEPDALKIQSITDKQALEDIFDAVDTDAGLLQNYRDASFYYTARMQLAYTRFPVAYKLLRYFNSLYPPAKRPQVRVLDYGCGVGDYALAFAVHGYHLTLVDIAGGNLEFAKWRFAQRGLPHEVVAVTNENLYPTLAQQDVILSGEVFEHVRKPMIILENIEKALPKGGLFWYSGYPDAPREVGGDHLQEAADVRLEALSFIQTKFKKATSLQLPGALVKKL